MKIMVIDDEYYAREALVSIIKHTLSNQMDRDIQSFDSAAAAMKSIPVFLPDVIFTDIRMDEMTGLDLCEYVHQNYPSIMLIIISGYADFSYAQKAIRYHVDRYLTKPVSGPDIEEVLQQIMAKIRQPEKPVPQNKEQGCAPCRDDQQNDQQMIIDPPSCRLIQHYLLERNIFSLMEILRESFDIFLSRYECSRTLLIKYFRNLFQIIQDHETALSRTDECLDFKRELMEKAGQISGVDAADALMNETLDYLRRALSENIMPEVTLAEKITAYIADHYFEDLNMNDLARNVFFISPNYLSKLVNDATGFRFSKYLLKIRMENALKILAREDLSISEVAQLTGYNSESHFIQQFKKYYGTTPKNYRMNLGL